MQVLQTPFARQQIEAAAYGRRATLEMVPEQTLVESVELSKGYDLSAPDVYKVVARRKTYRKGKLDEYATVTSNELAIRVVEPPE